MLKTYFNQFFEEFWINFNTFFDYESLASKQQQKFKLFKMKKWKSFHWKWIKLLYLFSNLWDALAFGPFFVVEFYQFGMVFSPQSFDFLARSLGKNFTDAFYIDPLMTNLITKIEWIRCDQVFKWQILCGWCSGYGLNYVKSSSFIFIEVFRLK